MSKRRTYKEGDRVKVKSPETGKWMSGTYRKKRISTVKGYRILCPHEVQLDVEQEAIVCGRKVKTDLWLTNAVFMRPVIIG